MSLVKDTGTILHWNVLTAKRPGLSRDLPPGQEKWTWVAYLWGAGRGSGRHLSHHRAIADVARLGARERQESNRDLRHAWTRRPFLRPRASPSAVPAREGACNTRGR